MSLPIVLPQQKVIGDLSRQMLPFRYRRRTPQLCEFSWPTWADHLTSFIVCSKMRERSTILKNKIVYILAFEEKEWIVIWSSEYSEVLNLSFLVQGMFFFFCPQISLDSLIGLKVSQFLIIWLILRYQIYCPFDRGSTLERKKVTYL